MSSITYKITLHPAQLDIWNNRARLNVLNCGRKFGKTTITKCIVAFETFDPRGRHQPIAYFIPEYGYMDEIWDDYLGTFYHNIEHRSKIDKVIRFSNGVSLRFFSLDNYDSVRPFQFGVHIYDEAAHSPYIREARQGAIAATGMKLRASEWFLSTPKGKNYFFEICERAKEQPDAKYFHFTTYDNPHIPVEMIENFKAEMPSLMFRQEILAEFVDQQGAKVKREWIKHVDSLPDDMVYSLGVDLAISKKETADYTSLVVSGHDKDGNLYVVDVQRGRWTFYEQQNEIIRMAERWNVDTVNVEQVQYQAAMVQELRRKTRLTVRGIKVSKDKVTRFAMVEGKYEHGLVFHVKGLYEFENELLSFPNADHDDMVDALVYSIDGLFTKRPSILV